jgi:type III pantothenate kinase
LSDKGEFLGGIVLPGMDMMRRSLAAGTAQLGRMQGSWQSFPRSTADAVQSGVVQATAGAIRMQHAALGFPAAPCVLSGGAAQELEPHLGLPLLRVDDLVLRGLQVIAQENGY